MEIKSRGKHRKKRDELDLEMQAVSSTGKIQVRFSQRERVPGTTVKDHHSAEAGTQGKEVRREHGVGVWQEWPLQ